MTYRSCMPNFNWIYDSGSCLKPCSLLRLGLRVKFFRLWSFLETIEMDKKVEIRKSEKGIWRYWPIEAAGQIKTWYDNGKLAWTMFFFPLGRPSQKNDKSSLTLKITKIRLKNDKPKFLRLLLIHNYSMKMHTKSEGNQTVWSWFLTKRYRQQTPRDILTGHNIHILLWNYWNLVNKH